jgi:hypothetical protein
MRLVLSIVLLSVPVAAAADDNPGIMVYGSTGGPGGTAAGLTTYLSSGLDAGRPVVCNATDDRSGQWIARLPAPGVYTAAVEEAYGFGPALRMGAIVSQVGFNRIHIELPFQYDLLQGSKPADAEHREFGQVFVAVGTAITGIAMANADHVLIALHETSAAGRQIGQTVRASSNYPYSTLPTTPGQKYYLRFTPDDGVPFRMHVVADNRYPDGSAYMDGKSQSSLDLALRIQYNPAGQIIRHRPRFTEVYKSAGKSYGQTFVAKGTSLAMLSVFPAAGDKPPVEPTIRILASGPEGKPIGPKVQSRILLFNAGQFPLAPGEKYYIEVSAPAKDSPIRLWTSRADDFKDGELFLDGAPVHDRDLAMILIEYEPDRVSPPSATALNWRPGAPPYVQRYPADGRVRLVWDLPASGDITRMIISRLLLARRDSGAEPEVIAEIPASAPGRHQYADAGLENGQLYRYTIRTVNAAGNKSEPLEGPAMPRPAIPMVAELLNSDFSGPGDSGLPYGWVTKTLDGAVPAFRLDAPDGNRNPTPAAGWEVSEEARFSDTVLCQRVPCEKGRRYQLAGEARVWNPWNTQQMIICAQVGIDPAGGSDPLARSVVWSSPTYQREKWTLLTIAAVAQADHVTVYLRGYSQYARQMNTRFRSVMLTEIAQGQ